MARKTTITGEGIRDNSVTGDDIDESTLVVTTLQDVDGDTKIQIEESADEDKIRFDTAGTERMIIDENGNVGIGTSSPTCTLSVAGSYSANITGINASNDPGTTYSVAVTDHILLINTRPTNQGGIDSSITITLPAAASFAGRVLTFKDAGGYSNTNGITIQRAGSDTIDGIKTSLVIPEPAAWLTFVSDGASNWFEIS